ncbi:hypothetical protein JTE90_020941 [Oedothorax gibbosus]|uniref:Uncharacterized protein n=1 Tax=Oedothorax gibbosus TaxID=931172 RepID=A0AAV6VPI1_9ARAC|nr:hypothetical protein JTE90_020941 [Oedothorax gibbosus]
MYTKYNLTFKHLSTFQHDRRLFKRSEHTPPKKVNTSSRTEKLHQNQNLTLPFQTLQKRVFERKQKTLPNHVRRKASQRRSSEGRTNERTETADGKNLPNRLLPRTRLKTSR